MGNPGRGIFCKTSYMKLIDNIILYGDERLLTVAPVKVISHHTGFVQTVRLVNPADAPFALAGNSLCIRVENIFAFIKYQPFFRIVRAIQAVSIFEFVYLQAENNHGKDIPDPIVFRKRNTDERPEGFSVEKHKLTGCGVVRGKSEINAAGQGRSAVNLIKSGPYFISPDIIQGL